MQAWFGQLGIQILCIYHWQLSDVLTYLEFALEKLVISMLKKLDILKSISLGQRVAEEEADELQRYFVKTDHWDKLANGEVDVIYGAKGSGKSALYTNLIKQAGSFKKKKILIISAENPRGATVFNSITADPPPTEVEFKTLWKLYILVLATNTIRENLDNAKEARSLISALEKATLLPAKGNRAQLFRAVTQYLKGWFGRDAASVKYELTMDATSGTAIAKRNVRYRKKCKTKQQPRNLDEFPIDDLLSKANEILDEAKVTLWLAFDRLDVAFAESSELERNSLRALFRAYNDLKGASRINLKIFVRDDVWKRITDGGFREASHITKSSHIDWTRDDLLNLVVLRLISNEILRRYYKVKLTEVKRNFQKQVDLFYKIFPDKVATGKNPATFDWIVSRTADGYGSGKPREVIHLIDISRQEQIDALERGGSPPESSQLIDRSSVKTALPLVSKVYFEQTLLAEYPEMKRYFEAFDGQKSTHTLITLTALWGLSKQDALEIVKKLIDIGFFSKKGAVNPEYNIPFLLRPALNTVQGKASRD